MRELEPLLMQQARYLVAQLRPWPRYPRALTVTPGHGSSEADIRPNAHTALGLAILYRIAPAEAFSAGFSKTGARDSALAILDFVLPTHGAAGIKCDNGKSWGNQWQSALWAAIAGEACWLLWDELTPEERWLAARMVCDEADRFVEQTPPAQEYADTKAEENAWNSQVISLAYSMFPQHPHHEIWRDTAIKWIASSFATEGDLSRTNMVDGKPLREWLTKANIHSDYTLENHNRVHPDYMSATTILTYQIPVYLWGGNRPPDAIHLNTEAIYANEKKLSFPDGGWVYPSGQDWHLHRNGDWLNYHAAMALIYGDPQAATLFRINLETLRRMAARDPNGPLTLPAETVFASSQSLLLDWSAGAYLLMAQFGEGPAPKSPRQLWKELAGRSVFAAGKFGLLRAEHSVASFSWGNQIMGMVLPLREDLLLTPNPRGLIGYVSSPQVANEAPVAQKIVVVPMEDKLGILGVLLRGNGSLEQRFGFLAMPDGRTIYVDTVHLLGEEKPTALDLGTLGVLNDTNWPYHNGTRTLVYDRGVKTFAAAQAATDSPVELSSRWYNLDGLGIVCLDGSGRQRYLPTPTVAAGRLEQLFHLNSVTANALVAATRSRPIAHSVLVFYPNFSIEQTRLAAQRCELRSAPGADRVSVALEDGVSIEFNLANQTLSIVAGARP